VYYLPFGRGHSTDGVLAGPTFDWVEMWENLTDDEHAQRLHRLEDAPLHPIQLHVEDKLHIVYQNLCADPAPLSVAPDMRRRLVPHLWPFTQQQIRHVADVTLERNEKDDGSQDRQSSPFVPMRPDAQPPLELRGYLTPVRDLSRSGGYPMYPQESSCWMAGRLLCLHEYQRGGHVVLRVIDMLPHRSRFVESFGKGALDKSFPVGLVSQLKLLADTAGPVQIPAS